MPRSFCPYDVFNSSFSVLLSFILRSYYLSRRFDRVIERTDLSIQLHFINRADDLADSRARLESQIERVAAHQQLIRRSLFDSKLSRAGDEPFFGFGLEIAFASQAVGARDPVEQIEFGLQGQSPEHAIGYRFGSFEPLVRSGMMFDERERLLSRVIIVEREK